MKLPLQERRRILEVQAERFLAHYEEGHVKIEPSKSNGLSKTSALDALQARGVDIKRFIRKLGRLTPMEMDDLAAAIAAVVEYQ
jgi:mRNA-degrading endonuclease toxin of MazEF toxin-antitoxin module